MVLPIFACLFGCGAQMSVTVTAAAAPDARRDSRFVTVIAAPDGPGVEDDKAIAKAAARALSARGFTEAGATDGNLAVVISWKLGKPLLRYRHIGADVSAPVSGAAPGKAGMPAGGSSNNATTGFGQGPEVLAIPFYPLTFMLKGVDRAAYAADHAAPPLWSVTFDSEADTDNVAQSAPQMMAAAMPYIGQTAAKVRVHIGSAEDPVKYVRGDIPALPVKKP